MPYVLAALRQKRAEENLLNSLTDYFFNLLKESIRKQRGWPAVSSDTEDAELNGWQTLAGSRDMHFRTEEFLLFVGHKLHDDEPSRESPLLCLLEFYSGVSHKSKSKQRFAHSSYPPVNPERAKVFS